MKQKITIELVSDGPSGAEVKLISEPPLSVTTDGELPSGAEMAATIMMNALVEAGATMEKQV